MKIIEYLENRKVIKVNKAIKFRIKEQMWQAYLESSRRGSQTIHVRSEMGEGFAIKAERFK